MKLLYLIIHPFSIENPSGHRRKLGCSVMAVAEMCTVFYFQRFVAEKKRKISLYRDVFFFLSVHRHACVIRGQVVTSDGTPLVGVNISFINSPSYGYTITRQDGR